jgi:bifunctional DNA-binding transcriptional regulator/antitoxin component of YhaV-PrlF toxin-antitoxin module
MAGYTITIKEKGRTLMPVALQRAANFGPGDTFIAQVNEDGDILLVNRRRALERMWASMELPEDSDAVANLKQARVRGDDARRQRLESFEVVDEKNLEERTAALLARMRRQ